MIKTYVTDEQIKQARDADLFAYLQTCEPGVLKRDGPNYRHREHDRNSRGKRINALDYLMEIRGYGFTEAVTRLTGEAVPRASPIHPQEQPKPRRPAKLFLPWPKKCATGLFTYLRKRGISASVIERCISLGLLYQGSYKPK